MLDGQLAEMATGEGKTLTAGMAAAVAAMTGQPVHLITANDYLVARDAAQLMPLFQSMGFTVGVVTERSSPQQRAQAYACHVTYCTAKELVFDYLRDQIETQHIVSDLHMHAAQLSQQAPNVVLRGVGIALLDEADSVLIDEATVPLILSKTVENSAQQTDFSAALVMADALQLDTDFHLLTEHMRAVLTPFGLQKMMQQTASIGGIWHNTLYVTELIQTALTARWLYHINQQYLIAAGEIKVIDPFTGRVAEGRVWSKGLHQMIALKEGLKPSQEVETMAQITYQRFFSQVQLLGGMSGTLQEARVELFLIYQLFIQQVPLFKPTQRKLLPSRVFCSATDGWQYVVQQVRALHQFGRPVLIGTDSVADSETLSALLKQHRLPHQVLNARQNAIEASIVSAAGQLGGITVSTNMAGRGTDIHISTEVANLGGLHVISCQHNDSARIDRQLIGRAARQGDPGSGELLMWLDHYPMYRRYRSMAERLIPMGGITQPVLVVRWLMAWPKWLATYHQRAIRHATFQQDAQLEKEHLSI